jgi:hypothetical protein
MKITFGKGLQADPLSSEVADGFMTDCTNIRVRNGFAEVVGGITTGVATFTGTGGGNLAQLYTSANSYVVCSTNSTVGVYTVGGSSTPDDITRETEGASISNATAVGTTVTITTLINHGRSTGNVISVFGFTPSTYNAESVSITVTSATTFTYTVASAPAVSPATAFGMYSRDGVTSHTTVTRGGELNGVLILNSTSAGCYYWGGNTSIPIRKIVGSYPARATVPFGNFIVQLAPTIRSGGVDTEYPFRILWSNATEPGDVPHNGFESTSTNQAGSVDKPEIGEMVWAETLGDDLIVYGTKGRLAMRYIDGNAVFSFTRLIGDEGLYGARMVASTPAGHVFVDSDRHVRIHSGGQTKDLSDGRVQSILGTENYVVFWVVTHPRQNEVWIGYRTNVFPGGSTAQFALIWNWESDTWGKAEISSQNSGIAVRTANSSTNLRLYMCGGSTNAVLNEYDNLSNLASEATIERIGMDAGDNDVVKNLQRSRWNIDSGDGFVATYAVSHGSSMFPATAPTYASSVPLVVGTNDYVNARATGGKYMATKLVITTTGAVSPAPYYNIRVRSADLDFTAGGRR